MFLSGILSYYCTLVTQHAKKATIHVLSNLVKLLDKAFLRDQDKKKHTHLMISVIRFNK